TKNQFTSQEPIEVSAESGTTTTAATTTEASTAEITKPATKPEGNAAKPNTDESEKGETEGDKQSPDVTGKNKQQQKDQEHQDNLNGVADNQPPAAPKQASAEKSVQEGSGPGSGQLLRRARDTSGTDVTVYYILGEFCKATIRMYKAHSKLLTNNLRITARPVLLYL
ncbi:unnamed protein product, partial [Echinostoma caproni]|uniref:Surface anchored protein n=1 Tax=Echinostoma caproni TaxID=27848 RepID=A0A183A484_9TREM